MTVWRPVRGEGPRPAWKVLLLDRDGVVIRDRGYLDRPDGVELIPGSADAMARARAAGWFLCGVSNQSGLGRGYFDSDQLEAVMRRTDELLEAAGAGFDAFAYCPHAPDDGCACRKPAVGLLEEVGLAGGLDGRSRMVGDKVSDVELGLNLGIAPMLVRTGHGREAERECLRRWPRRPCAVADDLAAAVDIILAGGEPER